MRWRRFGILTVAWVLALTLAATPAAASWSEWMSFTRIGYDGPFDSSPESWNRPDVQGNWVVWQKTLDSPQPDWSVYAYNLRTRTTKTVASSPGHQHRPRVYGDWVVYEEQDSGNAEIRAFNLSTNAVKSLTNRAGDQEVPDISGTKVVYFDSAAGDLYLYDLVKNTDTVLPLGAGTQNSPSISGNRVAYAQSGDIYVYDMTTSSVTRLTNDGTPINDSKPDIDGTLVAWARFAANSDIWCQDLAGGGAAAVVSTSDQDNAPRISGTHIVFVHDEGGTDENIGIYDRRVGDYLMLTSATTDDSYPAIDDLNVVYTAGYGTSGNFGGDIALGRLIAPSVSAKLSASAVRYGGKSVVTGSIVENGIALGSLSIALDKSTDGGHTWSQAAALTSNASGNFSHTTPALAVKTLYRARYNGSRYIFTINRFSALSAPVTVDVRASVGKPAGYPKTGNDTKSYSVYGSLKPRQSASAASAKVVVIKCYRRQSGKWKLRKTVNAKVSDYSTYSRYRANVKLPYAGRWRLRAYFKGSSTNAAKYSAYRYAAVN